MCACVCMHVCVILPMCIELQGMPFTVQWCMERCVVQGVCCMRYLAAAGRIR